jgi:hypothetical protein
VIKTYMKILDETADAIDYIDNKVIFSKQPLEISKKFGVDYLKKAGTTFKYSETAAETLKSFTEIMSRLFPTFENLLYSIISNSMVDGSTFSVNKFNAKAVAKGLMINKLLTTFRLKTYIMDKLSEEKFSPSISLREYHSVAKRRLFLNFTVIDVNNQRLAFFNKNTMPNMPLWAAIVACSSLPFFHPFFEGLK